MGEALYIFIVSYKSVKSSKERVKVLAHSKYHAIQKAKAEKNLFEHDEFTAYKAKCK